MPLPRGISSSPQLHRLLQMLEGHTDERPGVEVLGVSDSGIGSNVTLTFRANRHTPYVYVQVQSDKTGEGGEGYDPSNYASRIRHNTISEKQHSQTITRADDAHYYAYVIPAVQIPPGCGTDTLFDGVDGDDHLAFADLGKRTVGSLEIEDGTLSEFADEINHIGSTAPTDPKAGWIWLDTSTSPQTLNRYDGTSWVTYATIDAGWSGVVDDDGNRPEDGADVTASHASDVNHIGSTAPSSPQQGWLWLDTSTSPDTLKRYNGTSWDRVGTVEASWSGVLDDGSKPEDGADVTSLHALDITHVGSTAPSSPQEGWIWLDTSTNPDTLKRYDGAAWQKASTVDAVWSGVVDDGGKPADNADVTASNPQSFSWLTDDLPATKVPNSLIVNRMIGSGEVDEGHITVPSLAAINANLGTVTAGRIGVGADIAGRQVSTIVQSMAGPGRMAMGALAARVNLKGSTVHYGTSEPNTRIYKNGVLVVDAASPQSGNISSSRGDVFTSNKPVALSDSDRGMPLAPISAAGTQFAFGSDRSAPHYIAVYPVNGEATVEYYEGNGVNAYTAVPDQTKTCPADSVTIIQTSDTYDGEHRLLASSPCVMTKWAGGGGHDGIYMPPAATEVLVHLVDSRIAMDGSNPSSTGNYHYHDVPFVVTNTADGAGTDGEPGLPLEMLGDTYLTPFGDLDNYKIIAVEPTLITVEYWDGSGWVEFATHDLTSASRTNPQTADGGSGDDATGGGSGLAGAATNDVWRFSGSGRFFVRTNDPSSDEQPLIGVWSKARDSLDLGEVVADQLRNAADDHGVLLTGSVPAGWTRYLNLDDAANPFLKHEKLSLNQDGSATFSGDLSAASGDFAGDLSALQTIVEGELDVGGEPGVDDVVIHTAQTIEWKDGAETEGWIISHTQGNNPLLISSNLGSMKPLHIRASLIQFDDASTNTANLAGVVVSTSSPSGDYPEGTIWCQV